MRYVGCVQIKVQKIIWEATAVASFKALSCH